MTLANPSRLSGAIIALALLGALVAGCAVRDGEKRDGRSDAPDFTAAQADRGVQIFHERCAACHVVDGSDKPPQAVVGPAFRSRWSTVNDLYGLIENLMPADKAMSMTGPQTRDVVAYLLRDNGFTATGTDLPANRSAMRTMRISVQGGDKAGHWNGGVVLSVAA